MFTDDNPITSTSPGPAVTGLDTLEATACAHLTEVLACAGEGRSPVGPLAFGQTLGKCLLTDVLGRGGWCTVFRAMHQSLNICVAVKVLNLTADDPYLPQAREQLGREGQILARLHHPHIVRVFDFQDDPKLPFLVLECVDGPSLRDLIAQSGRLHAKRARTLMRQVAHGLAVIGSLGAVHRDIKPGNILLTRDGAAKIADFGQAFLAQPGQEPPPNPAGAEVAGTVAYVAPEQFLAPALVDQRSDLYSLGVTFYEAVTGRLPFQGRSRMEILLKHAKERPIPPGDLVPDLDQSLSELILLLLAKDPDDRPRDAAEVCAALSPPRPLPPRVPTGSETPRAPVPSACETARAPVPPACETARAPVPAAPPDRESWWSSIREWLGVRPQSVDHLWFNSMQRTLFPSGNRHSKPQG